MAQTGYTPIQLYYSTTASAVPLAANLAAGELAINTLDGKLYFKNSSGTVTLLAGAGGAITPITNNGVVYVNSSGQATSGSALTFDGTNLKVQTATARANITTDADLVSQNGLGILATSTTYGQGYQYVRFFNSSASYTGSISHTASTGIGLYSASDLILGANSAEGMRLTSTGLGIGTSSPSFKLQVEGAANSAALTLLRLNNSGTTGGGPGIASRISFTAGATALGYIQGSNFASGAAGLQFSGDGTNAQATLDSSGNLGLGVTPSAWYSTRKAMQIGSAGVSISGSTNLMEMRSNAYLNTSAQEIYVTSAAASLYAMNNGVHYWYTAPSGTAGNAITFTQAMTLDASGRLGIGTTSPSLPLEIFGASTVYGDARYLMGLLDTSSATTGTGAGIALSGFTNGTSAGATFAQIKGIKENSTAGNTAGAFVISTLPNGGSPTERARIDSSGQFGIGTSTPYSRLDLGTYGSNSQLSWHQDSTTAYGYIGLQNNSAAIGLMSGLKMGASANSFASSISATWAKSAILLDYGNIKFFTNTADTVSYGTTYTPTERARIDSSGYLIVGGTTPYSVSGGGTSVVTVEKSQANRTQLSVSNQTNNSSAGAALVLAAYGADWILESGATLKSGNSLTFSYGTTERSRFGGGGGLSIAGGLAVGTLTEYPSSFFLASAVLSAGAGTYPLKWNSSNGIVTYDTSSRLVKENIEDSPYGLDEVLRLKPRKYYRTDDHRNEIGLVADEVQAVMPEFVPLVAKSIFTKDEADTELIAGGVNYDKLTSVLIKAIQEQQAIIESLKARLDAANF